LRIASNSALHDDAAVDALELQRNLDFGCVIKSLIGKIKS
jgi:hypothetical protein